MGKFVIKQSKAGYSFSLKANNGEIIAIGGEVFSSMTICKNSIESVIKNAQIANVEDQTVNGFQVQKHPKFEIFFDKAGEFRFRLRARNGESILTSEGYTAKANCKNGIASVCKNVVDATIVKAE